MSALSLRETLRLTSSDGCATTDPPHDPPHDLVRVDARWTNLLRAQLEQLQIRVPRVRAARPGCVDRGVAGEVNVCDALDAFRGAQTLLVQLATLTREAYAQLKPAEDLPADVREVLDHPMFAPWSEDGRGGLGDNALLSHAAPSPARSASSSLDGRDHDGPVGHVSDHARRSRASGTTPSSATPPKAMTLSSNPASHPAA